ncbi:hypothetical protein JGU71_20395 [Antrihabitans sp. YC3-6]|uniref:Uncharacterized protein n=1 Tax=Antrihabitans stalagmiti TaxID=2799499 RepID=A0A934U569_9NOCA|nr:hypothetical protein [Antrihabitans stalagmiti]MBJ8341249.1 hypothetical protein [Antrihabitans stalagmiti]
MSERTIHPGASVRVTAGPELSADASEYVHMRLGNAPEHAGEACGHIEIEPTP